jgi:hypothetical protein
LYHSAEIGRTGEELKDPNRVTNAPEGMLGQERGDVFADANR